MSNFNLQRADALKGVERTYRQLIDAWNRRNTTGMAALMQSHDGLMIGFDGSTMIGRDDAARHVGRSSSMDTCYPAVRHEGLLGADDLLPPGSSTPSWE